MWPLKKMKGGSNVTHQYISSKFRCENLGLLGYNALSMGEKFLTLQRQYNN
jgi:hypothetical protein